MKYGRGAQTQTPGRKVRGTKKMILGDDAWGEVLVHGGPLRGLVCDANVRRDVAARRIQRQWRCGDSLVSGARVIWRFRSRGANGARGAWQLGRVVALSDTQHCIVRDVPKRSYIFLPHPGVTWRRVD